MPGSRLSGEAMFRSTSNKFRVPKFLFLPVLLLAISAISAQENSPRGKQNPYSPSPGKNAKTQPPAIPQEIAFRTQDDSAPKQEERPTVAQSTFNIAKTASVKTLPPTEVYKVGVGDVLFINLKNSPRASGYHTVRPDGTIDFPLAGEHVVVADQTVESIEEIIASSITLYTDPQIEVRVREYGSHRIAVSGRVERAGEKNLQREAIPLFVIRAEAMVDPTATKVRITRAPLLKAETYDLRDPKTEDVLIYPGNSVEFIADGSGFYFISGEVAASGQKEFTAGLTLYQAVVAAGAVKSAQKKAVIRRKSDNGMFSLLEFNLRAIRDGKAADPALIAGDIVEVRN